MRRPPVKRIIYAVPDDTGYGISLIGVATDPLEKDYATLYRLEGRLGKVPDFIVLMDVSPPWHWGPFRQHWKEKFDKIKTLRDPANRKRRFEALTKDKLFIKGESIPFKCVRHVFSVAKPPATA
jgi:hypothetical protein